MPHLYAVRHHGQIIYVTSKQKTAYTLSRKHIGSVILKTNYSNIAFTADQGGVGYIVDDKKATVIAW